MLVSKQIFIHLIVLCLVAQFTASCGSRPKFTPEQPYWVDDDRVSYSEPDSRDLSLIWFTADRTAFQQALELADLERDFRILFGSRKEAQNVNSFDEIPNSSWFTNRHGLTEMTPDEVLRGIALTDGPDTSGSWILSRPKVGGATPGFWITDSRGDIYIIKFDPAENPEMATAAAAMGSRYFHACGYNVPQETIVYWNPERVIVEDGLTYKDSNGIQQPFTRGNFNEIVNNTRRTASGLIRSSASLLIPNSKGPFSYRGRRKDDPNDWLSHQDRRELRGLRVIGSWINHYDLKDHNTLDAFIETAPGMGYMKHYLIDFGSAFGSDGNKVKHPRKGYANWFDLRDVLVTTFTLGFKRWGWEKSKPYQYPSIGYFESEIFQPEKFDPIVPNPAFENLTGRDAFWGAKIVMAFRDAHIRALIAAGEFSNPDAADYLFQTLKIRRDKIGRHWFSKVNPLDKFALSEGDDTLAITFVDLALAYNLADNAATTYRYRVLMDHNRNTEYRILSEPRIALPKSVVENTGVETVSVNSEQSDASLLEIQIQTSRDGSWTKRISLWVMYVPRASGGQVGRFKLVGIQRKS